MAQEEALRTIGSLVADSSLAVFTGVPGQPGSASPNSGMQYRFAKVSGPSQLGLCTAATDVVAGVVQSKPQFAGQSTTLGIGGISMIAAGAAVTAGDLLAPDATGRAVTDNAHGKWQALTTVGAAGDLVRSLRVL
jgi:hypothetical protein